MHGAGRGGAGIAGQLRDVACERSRPIRDYLSRRRNHSVRILGRVDTGRGRGQPESVDRRHRVRRHSIHLKVKSRMPLSIARIAELAQYLETAARERRTVPKLSDMEPQLTLADAYEVQWSLRHRRPCAGSRASRLEMGVNSRAKVKQTGDAA